MRLPQLEAWVLSVADRVRQQAPLEDGRVEAKADWPDPSKAARRLAGHANAAGGDAILWIIGLDEVRGPVGAQSNELGDWWNQVQTHFDSIAPALTDLVVPFESVTLIALAFDTTRAPFLVKNPVFGQPGGGPVQLEVPWRAATAVRSATRADLLRLLVPLEQLPSVEVLRAHLHRMETPLDGLTADVFMSLYIVPRGNGRIVIPFHRCHGVLRADGSLAPFGLESINLHPPTIFSPHGSSVLSHTIAATSREVIIDGPGEVQVHAYARVPFSELPPVQTFAVAFEGTPVLMDRPISVAATLTKQPPGAHDVSQWQLGVDEQPGT